MPPDNMKKHGLQIYKDLKSDQLYFYFERV